MPTQSTTYNTRVTDENLEKRFRDTFRSQGGAELVDDLYASGVIVPVVDFTAAAEGTNLRQDLQTAANFGCNTFSVTNSTTAIIQNAGFFRIDYQISTQNDTAANRSGQIKISNGISTKNLVSFTVLPTSTRDTDLLIADFFVVFLTAADSVSITTTANFTISGFTRQIADVNGTLVDPTGFVPQ